MEDSIRKVTEMSDNGSADFLRDFVDQMPGGFFVYRASGNEDILHVNKALLGIFGCESSEEFAQLTGNSFRGMVHADDLDRVEKSIAVQVTQNNSNLDYVESDSYTQLKLPTTSRV